VFESFIYYISSSSDARKYFEVLAGCWQVEQSRVGGLVAARWRGCGGSVAEGIPILSLVEEAYRLK
jgi:hypothetical protein